MDQQEETVYTQGKRGRDRREYVLPTSKNIFCEQPHQPYSIIYYFEMKNGMKNEEPSRKFYCTHHFSFFFCGYSTTLVQRATIISAQWLEVIQNAYHVSVHAHTLKNIYIFTYSS